MCVNVCLYPTIAQSAMCNVDRQKGHGNENEGHIHIQGRIRVIIGDLSYRIEDVQK